MRSCLARHPDRRNGYARLSRTEWILPVFITAVALGFPVVLVFAWAFEVKGGAIEKTPEPAGALSPANKRPVWLLAAAGLIIRALAVGGDWIWHPRSSTELRLLVLPR
jgi:hypothetical protein